MLGLGSFAGHVGALESEVTIHSDAGAPVGACDLGATLDLPPDARAIVVLVAGSGPQDRDESMRDGNGVEFAAPFRDIARTLSAHGIASLRYDERDRVEACKAAAVRPGAVPEHFMKDMEAVLARAKQEAPGVPAYLLGHSEGVSYVLESVARGRAQVAGMILIAGLGRYAIDETMLRQLEVSVREVSEALKDPLLTAERRAELEKQLAMIEKLESFGRTFFKRVRAGQTRPEEGYYLYYAEHWRDLIAMTERGAANASAAGKPSLLLQGERDGAVTREDFDALAQALAPNGGTSAMLPGLDHLLNDGATHGIHASALQALAGWFDAQLPPGARPGMRQAVNRIFNSAAATRDF